MFEFFVYFDSLKQSNAEKEPKRGDLLLFSCRWSIHHFQNGGLTLNSHHNALENRDVPTGSIVADHSALLFVLLFNSDYNILSKQKRNSMRACSHAATLFYGQRCYCSLWIFACHSTASGECSCNGMHIVSLLDESGKSLRALKYDISTIAVTSAHVYKHLMNNLKGRLVSSEWRAPRSGCVSFSPVYCVIDSVSASGIIRKWLNVQFRKNYYSPLMMSTWFNSAAHTFLSVPGTRYFLASHWEKKNDISFCFGGFLFARAEPIRRFTSALGIGIRRIHYSLHTARFISRTIGTHSGENHLFVVKWMLLLALLPLSLVLLLWTRSLFSRCKWTHCVLAWATQSVQAGLLRLISHTNKMEWWLHAPQSTTYFQHQSYGANAARTHQNCTHQNWNVRFRWISARLVRAIGKDHCFVLHPPTSSRTLAEYRFGVMHAHTQIIIITFSFDLLLLHGARLSAIHETIARTYHLFIQQKSNRLFVIILCTVISLRARACVPLPTK